MLSPRSQGHFFGTLEKKEEPKIWHLEPRNEKRRLHPILSSGLARSGAQETQANFVAGPIGHSHPIVDRC